MIRNENTTNNRIEECENNKINSICNYICIDYDCIEEQFNEELFEKLKLKYSHILKYFQKDNRIYHILQDIDNNIDNNIGKYCFISLKYFTSERKFKAIFYLNKYETFMPLTYPAISLLIKK